MDRPTNKDLREAARALGALAEDQLHAIKLYYWRTPDPERERIIRNEAAGLSNVAEWLKWIVASAAEPKQ